MILAAAVCPHPPALVAGLAPGFEPELDDLRRTCDEAVADLVALAPDRIIVLGTGTIDADHDERAGGSLAHFGVAAHAGGPGDELPLSLTIGAWLLDRAGWAGARTYSTGSPDTAGDVAILVMADGSAARSAAAPGSFDERAEPFDAHIAAALAAGDAEALAALDVELGAELGAAGTPALRTLGMMTLASTTLATTKKGADVTARLRMDVAPLGVGYWVADWVFG